MGKNKKLTKKTPKSFASRRFSFWSELLTRSALTFAVTVTASVFVISMINDVLALAKAPRETTVTVDEPSNLADALGNNGIIDHPWLFSLYVKLRGEPELVQTEGVTVDSDMDYRQLLSAFTVTKRQSVIRLTIPSGATTDEIIDLFTSNGLGSREGFEDTINNYPFECDFLIDKNFSDRKYRLDGYLYPDTYDFYTDRSEAYYIYKLLDRFSAVTADIRKAEEGLDLDSAVILASMIRLSSSRVGQYEYISSVFHNRLKLSADYPTLDCPASSVYGSTGGGGVYLGCPTEDVKLANTAYNTFMNEGLPPGPICNPDINAIVCAIRPAESNYRYFVTDGNGEALFASNKREHEKNCRSVTVSG